MDFWQTSRHSGAYMKLWSATAKSQGIFLFPISSFQPTLKQRFQGSCLVMSLEPCHLRCHLCCVVADRLCLCFHHPPPVLENYFSSWYRSDQCISGASGLQPVLARGRGRSTRLRFNENSLPFVNQTQCFTWTDIINIMVRGRQEPGVVQALYKLHTHWCHRFSSPPLNSY